MKKIFFVILAAGILSFSGIILSPQTQAVEDAKSAHVVAYYFHGTFRCPTCFNMEMYSREAIETNFKDALSSGKLKFKAVNVEDRGNKHYTNDYKLYTKSLILSLVKDGKEIKSKNLEKIWEYVYNKQKFIDYVTSEVNELMKDVK